MGNSTRFVSRSAKEQLIYFFNHILAHNTLEVTEGVLSFFFFIVTVYPTYFLRDDFL